VGISVELGWEIIGIYLGMVLFGLFAYAVIIPYFTIRKFRKMLESGEGAKMILALLQTPITIKDSAGNPHEMELANYLISLAIQNMKMQLNSLKSAFFRGVSGGEGEEDAGGLGQILEACPKKWRWAAQLLLPLVAAKVQQGASTGAAGAAAPAATAAFRGV